MSKRCSAKNRSGKRCGAWAVTGATKCALHADPERAAELGSKRGRRVKFRHRPDALDLPPRPLKSTEEVCELLEETINLVRRGSLDVRAANSIDRHDRASRKGNDWNFGLPTVSLSSICV